VTDAVLAAIERVARAIWDAKEIMDWGEVEVYFQDAMESDKDQCRQLAKAAMKALLDAPD
jgi:hypothetical protein